MPRTMYEWHFSFSSMLHDTTCFTSYSDLALGFPDKSFQILHRLFTIIEKRLICGLCQYYDWEITVFATLRKMSVDICTIKDFYNYGPRGDNIWCILICNNAMLCWIWSIFVKKSKFKIWKEKKKSSLKFYFCSPRSLFLLFKCVGTDLYNHQTHLCHFIKPSKSLNVITLSIYDLIHFFNLSVLFFGDFSSPILFSLQFSFTFYWTRITLILISLYSLYIITDIIIQ